MSTAPFIVVAALYLVALWALLGIHARIEDREERRFWQAIALASTLLRSRNAP